VVAEKQRTAAVAEIEDGGGNTHFLYLTPHPLFVLHTPHVTYYSPLLILGFFHYWLHAAVIVLFMHHQNTSGILSNVVPQLSQDDQKEVKESPEDRNTQRFHIVQPGSSYR
jgi:hypothetical protein